MELRKDYILDRWVIVAPHRGKRPHDFQVKTEQTSGHCPFCPGSESETPTEIGRIESNSEWIVRWFPNKFAILHPHGSFDIKTHNNFYTFGPAQGSHEVIVETRDHNKQLHELSVSHIVELLKVYNWRIEDLSKDYEYVVVFKNHGVKGGTSLLHSHTQVTALKVVPPSVREEVAASTGESCRYCDIIAKEKNSTRAVFENEFFVAFCPYASRYNYEVWVFTKEHMGDINNMDDYELRALAEILKKILVKLGSIHASYNMVIHYSPKNEDLHFHIEIKPRIATWGGFELSTGIIVNKVAPESAAEFYRS